MPCCAEVTESSTNKQHHLSHSQRGRTGRERPDVEADADEGGPRLQSSTDRVACVTVPQQQHQPCHTAGWGPRRRRRPPCNADPHDTFPANNNRQEEMRTSCCQQPVLHSDMQQRCHHTSGSARSQSWQARPPSQPAAGSHCPAHQGSAPH